MENRIHVQIKERDFEFMTSPAVFSPGGADKGTLAMLSQVTLHNSDKLLDLGCGYGLVGIWASYQLTADQIVMSDIAEEALELARQNAKLHHAEGIHIVKSFGLDSIEEDDFTVILSNPPYHEDFQVPKNFIEKGYRKLAVGGRMYMVTKRLDWYKNKLTSVFGGVRVSEIDGYYVFCAEKRVKKQVPKKEKTNLSKKLQRKYSNQK